MKHYITAVLLIFILTASSFKGKTDKTTYLQDAEIQIDDQPGACPHLTKDRNGRVILSWARSINDTTSVFCFVRSNDGRSFSKPVTVPMSDNLQAHSENLPKMIVKPSGEMIALWGAANPNPANKYAGTVYYSRSTDEGSTWSKPALLVNDPAGNDQRYYDVVLLPGGEVGVIWLDDRKTGTAQGSSLYFASTGRNGEFENERRIAEGCCQCCRTDLFVDEKGGIHVLYRGIIQDSIRDMLHSVSDDGGRTFSSPKRISYDNWVLKGCPHTGPAMTSTGNGLHFAWFTGGQKKGCFYTQSRDNGNNFDRSDRISMEGSHPQILSFQNKVLIAWDEPGQQGSVLYRRIGLQMRGADGNKLMQDFVTGMDDIASYPVMVAVDDKSVLLSYTTKKKDRSMLMVKRISVE